MIAGIFVLLAGMLIAIYPPILSIMVAAVLVMLGVTIMVIAYHQRRLRRHFDNPSVEFFFRL